MAKKYNWETPAMKKAIRIVNRLRKSIKKSYPKATYKEIDWSIDAGSEYNPKDFAEAKRICIKLLKIKHNGMYHRGMKLHLH